MKLKNLILVHIGQNIGQRWYLITLAIVLYSIVCIYSDKENLMKNELNQMFQYITDDGTLNAYIDIHCRHKALLFIFLWHCQMFYIPINTQQKPNGMEM